MTTVRDRWSDSERLQDATGGREDFATFFDRNVDQLVRSLALTLGDHELAADAVAEAMVKAHLRWRRLAGSTNPAGWVYRVALNWARARGRRWWREVTTSEPPERPVVAVGLTDPELAVALLALPVEQRAVVVLRYLLDWSEARTATALDIPPGTVKSRLSRALTRLAEQLGGPDEH